MRRLLPQSFYERDTLTVARELLGKRLRCGPVELRITEVEAYLPGDSASHCRMGRTDRNAPMWARGGHAYVYLCYGMHNLLNFVTEAEGRAAAVLVRSCEPVAGLGHIQQRRGGQRGPALLTGPGKVGAALGLDTGWCGHALFKRGGLSVLQDEPVQAVLRGPRVGIGYADAEHLSAPWRLAVADTPWVSQRKALAPTL